MKKRQLIFTILMIFSFGSVAFSAEFYSQNIPDSSEIRKQIVDKWFLQDLKHLRMQESEIYKNSVEQKFQVRMEELEDSFAIIVAPSQRLELELISENDVKSSEIDIYPYDSPGSWVLFRDKKTEEPLSVRYYFLKNSEIFVEFDTDEYSSSFIKKKGKSNKVYGSFILFDMYVAQSIPVGLTIDDLYVLSFNDIVEISRVSLPWKYATFETNLYDNSLQMIGVIRERLDSIQITPDACYDGELKPARVSDGKARTENLSEGKKISLDRFGFIKWIVDGLVRPITGSNLEIDPLKIPTVPIKNGSKVDQLQNKFNVYFALDWTRNLAAAYLSVISGNNYSYESSGCEVNVRPFSSRYTSKGIKTFPTYIKNSGYAIEILKALFYIFAIEDPGRFYLGAVRETDNSVPENVFYSRAVAFFPYFDAEGNFFVSIFEDGKECSIEEFMNDNKGVYVNLVRLQTSQGFFPQ